MNPADLAISGTDWFRLAGGLVLFLLPGLALADRIFGPGWGLATAPVFSFTSLALVAILLDFTLGVPVRAAGTAALAVAVTLAAGARRLSSWWGPETLSRSTRPPAPEERPRWTWKAAATVLALAGVFALLAAVHALPHFPGQQAEGLQAWGELASRLGGEGHPYPVHVDEHYHMAQAAAIDRQQRVAIDDPYTGSDLSGSFFTVSGFRYERGFDLATVQATHLLDITLPTLYRFLPALWAGYLGVMLYAALRPAPGALAAAALVAILPTTVRFLGVGFLVPSAFGLPWLLVTVLVVTKTEGARRFAAMLLLITGGMFLHLVVGTLCIVVGLLGALLVRGLPTDRLALATATLLPLTWILPSTWVDIRDAVASEHTLPFAQEVFATPGAAVYVIAAVGAAVAWMQSRDDTRPHRILALLALGTAISMAWSLQQQHANDATYSRLVHTFFLCIAVLAGLAVGTGAQSLARYLASRGSPAMGRLAAATVATLVVGALVTGALADHYRDPYYRVFDDRSWQAARDLADAGAQPGDVFLSEAWRAPVYNAVTGAYPHAVLHPGSLPVRGSDYIAYVASNGTAVPPGLDWVVGPPAPAGGRHVGGDVFAAS